jgi:hypothetical protein
MSEKKPTELEAALERVTRHEGGETRLWERALEQVREEDATARRSRFRVGPAFGGALVAATVLIVAGVAVLPQLGGAHERAPIAQAPADETAAEEPWNADGIKEFTLYNRLMPGTDAPALDVDASVSAPARGAELGDRVEFGLAAEAAEVSQNAFYPPAAGAAAVDEATERADFKGADRAVMGRASVPFRRVVRHARVDLVAEDVEAALDRASSLAREELGEYVERAIVRGDDERRLASATLRIRAERVEEVVEELRGLGEATEVSIEGRDVTQRVVDLDATLRNEKSVERELLGLLETREDEPLEDVLRKGVKGWVASIDDAACDEGGEGKRCPSRLAS